MLENPVQREIIKGGGVVAASLAPTGTPALVASALAVTLGVAVEALGNLGDKRTRELFDTQIFVEKTIEEIKRSDDFASFVYDTWLKHNLESSEARRKRLKKILNHAVITKSRDFENFTRINIVAQQISEKQVLVLNVFYKAVDKQGRLSSPSGSSLSGYVDPSFKINATLLSSLLKKNNVELSLDGGDGIVPTMNQLSYFGLVGMYVAMNGEYYMDTKFGRIFLEYINS